MKKLLFNRSFFFILCLILFGTGTCMVAIMVDETQNADEAEIDIQSVSTKGVSGEQISFGVIQSYLDLTNGSSQDEVIEAMHGMTHQKVRANNKRGAIPMTVTTVDELYRIISNSRYELKTELLEIADRWKKNDFSQIVEDHNYLWEYQNGEDGKAYGVFSKAEEKAFVEINFGEDSKSLLNGM